MIYNKFFMIVDSIFILSTFGYMYNSNKKTILTSQLEVLKKFPVINTDTENYQKYTDEILKYEKNILKSQKKSNLFSTLGGTCCLISLAGFFGGMRTIVKIF